MSFYNEVEVAEIVRERVASYQAQIRALELRLEWAEGIIMGQIKLQPPAPIILSVTPDEAKRITDQLRPAEREVPHD